MQQWFAVTFDLENGKPADYNRAYGILQDLGFTLSARDDGTSYRLPNTTCIAELDLANAVSGAAVRDLLKSEFGKAGIPLECLLVVKIEEWATWGPRAAVPRPALSAGLTR